jgi:hypothetical protein
MVRVPTKTRKSKIQVFEASIANTLACFLGAALDIVSKQVSIQPDATKKIFPQLG